MFFKQTTMSGNRSVIELIVNRFVVSSSGHTNGINSFLRLAPSSESLPWERLYL